jgi:hypothetical protein
MNIGTIVGTTIGLPVGVAVGFMNPIVFNPIYPTEWTDAYNKNGAVVLLTSGYGAVGGVIGGAVGGTISHNLIRDGGFVGGALGGAVGGTVGGVYCIYRVFLDKQSNP